MAKSEVSRPRVPFLPTRRLRRPKPIVVVLTTLTVIFGLGAMFAVAVALAGGNPAVPLVEVPTEPSGPHTAVVSLTALTVDAAAGQMQARVTIAPSADMMDSGNLSQDLTVVINDANGPNSQTLKAGDPIPPLDVTLPLVDGAIAQYPFDTYTSLVLVRLTSEDGSKDGEGVPISMAVQSNLAGFDMTAEPAEGTTLTNTDIALGSFGITRSWASFVYALGTMAIMLALAFTGLRIIWATYVWQVVSPPWLYGFFIGALFALPPLRSSLPGAPPAGAIVDYLSFYPAVAVIAVAMLVTLSRWLAGVKPLPGEPPSELPE